MNTTCTRTMVEIAIAATRRGARYPHRQQHRHHEQRERDDVAEPVDHEHKQEGRRDQQRPVAGNVPDPQEPPSPRRTLPTLAARSRSSRARLQPSNSDRSITIAASASTGTISTIMYWVVSSR